MIKVLFMGRKQVARDCLESLLNRSDIEVVGVLTDSHLEGSVTTQFAHSIGLKTYSFDEALLALETGELEHDVGLSMLYWRKFQGPFLTVPKYGLINFHPAPLPDYKGVGGYNLAILERRSDWAASAHFVDTEIDTGPIIKVDRFDIDPDNETAQSLEKKSQLFLRDLFESVVEMLVADPNKMPRKPNNGGTYLSRLELEAMKEIDFDEDDVSRKVRAFWFPPYDGAYIVKGGQKYTLVDHSILKSLADPAASSLFTSPAKKKSS